MKKCYVITFELKNPGLNQGKVLASIKTAPWAKLSNTCFVIMSDLSAVQIRDIILKVLYKQDKLYVSMLDDTAAWYGLSEDVSTWIRNNQK